MLDLIKPHLTEILGLITTLLTGGGWLYERKKNKQTLLQADTENAQKIIDLYQEALSDLKERYDDKIADIQEEIDRLRKNVELWKNKYRDLKNEFEAYKRTHP